LVSLTFHAGIELLHTCRDNEYLTRMARIECLSGRADAVSKQASK